MTMDPALLAAVAAAALAVVGVIGIMVPVLPGSLTIIAALLVWAWWGSSPWGWVAFGVGGVLVVAGMLASWVLARRDLKAREIPQWPVLVGLASGIVGMFVLPGFGLVVGFVAGLLLSEFARVRDWRRAVDTSWVAVKAIGLGMLVELACGLIATSVLAASILTSYLA